jgi:hypothetical protein
MYTENKTYAAYDKNGRGLNWIPSNDESRTPYQIKKDLNRANPDADYKLYDVICVSGEEVIDYSKYNF